MRTCGEEKEWWVAREGSAAGQGGPCCQRRGTQGDCVGGGCGTASLCHPPHHAVQKCLVSLRNTDYTFLNLWWSHCPCMPWDRVEFLVPIAKWWTSSLLPSHRDLCNDVLLGHSKQTKYYECPGWPEWNHHSRAVVCFSGVQGSRTGQQTAAAADVTLLLKCGIVNACLARQTLPGWFWTWSEPGPTAPSYFTL